MVDILFRTKKSGKADIDETKPWEKAVGWTNPFDNDEESLRRERKEERKRRKQKKKRSHKHRMTEEEYDEMSSKADSMLEDVLGEDHDNFAHSMPQVREESFGNEDEDSVRAVQQGSNPFDDLEEENEVGEELNKEDYAALMHGMNKTPTHKPVNNPFADDEEASSRNADEVDYPKDNANNPFEDDSLADSTVLGSVEEFPQNGLDKAAKAEEDLTRKHTDTTEEEQVESVCSSLEPPAEFDEEEEEEDVEEAEREEEEDIVESSKRLLRMADERIQYQQHSDEVKTLRETIDVMKHQAEAMTEQLRRAIETKCDLVLAQTEMERCHEQNLIAKDDEIRDMKLYTIELIEVQSQNELSFMNEISSLSNQLTVMDEKRKIELAKKDEIISKLELQLKSIQIDLTEEPSVASVHSFRSRFFESGNSAISAIRVL